MSQMTPKEIVNALDQHIVGQPEAKRAVAVAMRNRWRRMQLDDDLRPEVTPKNILMIGPTGVGKTEIARRLAKLAGAPFLKIEATKFTEVGYVGRDVESIIRDLVEVAMKLVREDAMKEVRDKAEDAAEAAGWDVPKTKGCVAASDAFFPFADGLLQAASAGAVAVIQPGGSIRDDEVIAAADDAGLAMVFTGMRHFRH